MLHLRFKGEGHNQQATLGPCSAFRVSGNFIRDGESGTIMARYHHHFWEVQGKFFTRYDCYERVSIYFEDAEGGQTEHYGPFESLWVADGSLYTAKKLFAKFMDPTLMWHNHEGDTFWPVMVLAAPDS